MNVQIHLPMRVGLDAVDQLFFLSEKTTKFQACVDSITCTLMPQVSEKSYIGILGSKLFR